MLQANDRLPDVPLKPAPWSLRGQGWIVALQLPGGSTARDAFLPAGLAGLGRGPSLLMFVDYAASDCGPYHELLFIPGTFPFSDGKRHLTISRILVSTWDSVINGRRNWGIPKDRADFDVRYGIDGTREDHISVRSDGRLLADLRLSSWPLPLPVFGGIVPEAMRTLAQRFGASDYYYAPSSRGWIRPGRLLSWQFDAALFPDLAGARVLAAVKIPSFHMTFPVSRTRPANAPAG